MRIEVRSRVTSRVGLRRVGAGGVTHLAPGDYRSTPRWRFPGAPDPGTAPDRIGEGE
jgi:hypothetical protein